MKNNGRTIARKTKNVRLLKITRRIDPELDVQSRCRRWLATMLRLGWHCLGGEAATQTQREAPGNFRGPEQLGKGEGRRPRHDGSARSERKQLPKLQTSYAAEGCQLFG